MIFFKRGYESWVVVLRIRESGVCFKVYRNNLPTKWLRDKLAAISEPKTHRLKLIPRHEYRILQKLFELDVAPKPLVYSYNLLITTYGGEPISNLSDHNLEFLNREGTRLFVGLKYAGISHNDVKSSNVLFRKEKLALIDFTFSDTPHIRLSSLKPNPDWGRFDGDQRLLDLVSLLQNPI